jgi:hypothetical protein
MNPDQYSCNMGQIFLTHAIDYPWFYYHWGNDDVAFRHRPFFRINAGYEWNITLYLGKNKMSDFVRVGNKSAGYDSYSSLNPTYFFVVVYF